MKPGTLSFYEHAVRNAMRAVTCNLDQALDVHALALGAALSPFHFHRVFRGMVGETPIELHRRLRLERAAWCLRHQETPVTEIAFAAGYETHESFTRAFRLRYDCGDWLPKSGHRMRDGVSFEVYRNMPGEVPDDRLETEIYIPLE
jgi:AraC family transcriptional regulator